MRIDIVTTPGWRVVMSTAMVLALAAVITINVPSHAQSFNSGSDETDGALTVAANQGTIVFDPLDTARWGRVLDPDGDGVYNFTTITINSGSALRLLGDKVTKPVHWLASGDVVINGTLDLSGSHGADTQDLSVRRLVPIPGSGGYAGGAGGRSNSPAVPAMPGDGPGGGSGGVNCVNDTARVCGKGGTFTGNRYLIPLVGGSGGEGALWNSSTFFAGGAGGGAILIASSTSITIGGNIYAYGGSGAFNFGGAGSGGAIRLVAPTLAGGGHLNVGRGGATGDPKRDGSIGWVRLEGFQISNSLNLDNGSMFATRGSPVDPNSLRPAGLIRVTAINGIPVPPNPSGSFVLPDVTINSNSPVNVDIQASGIPPGTTVTLQVFPQSPEDLTTVNLPTAQATLAGTLQSSTATATFTFPYGFSRGQVRANWTQ